MDLQELVGAALFDVGLHKFMPQVAEVCFYDNTAYHTHSIHVWFRGTAKQLALLTEALFEAPTFKFSADGYGRGFALQDVTARDGGVVVRLTRMADDYPKEFPRNECFSFRNYRPPA